MPSPMTEPTEEMHIQCLFSRSSQSSKVVEITLDCIEVNHTNCHLLPYPSLTHSFIKISPYLLWVKENKIKREKISFLSTTSKEVQIRK